MVAVRLDALSRQADTQQILQVLEHVVRIVLGLQGARVGRWGFMCEFRCGRRVGKAVGCGARVTGWEAGVNLDGVDGRQV